MLRFVKNVLNKSVLMQFDCNLNLYNTKLFGIYREKSGFAALSNESTNTVQDVESAQQKTSSALTDTFGRFHTYLRISLTERCNLRCKYCMPSEGVKLTPNSNILTSDEILYIATLFVEQGVRKIRLTGGEPTVRKDIVDIIQRMKNIPDLETVSITTNAIALTRLLVPMQKAGLDGINISLDTLKKGKYEEITRRKGWERVIAGIDLAIQLGYKPKVNCVLMKNFNDDEICDFVDFTQDRDVDVRFIEYMPFTGNKWNTDQLVPFREALNAIKKKWPNLEELENGPNDTSKAFAVPGFKGQVGFITSMTEHFCGSCNRLRITADGNLKVCLFGNTEISLRDAIRNESSRDDLVALISAAVKRKKKQHADYKNTQNPSTINLRGIPQLSTQLLYFKNVQKIPHTRLYCTTKSPGLSHIDSSGKAAMVDVSSKRESQRFASARATVYVGPLIATLINENNVAKGDVLSISQIAGILAAKKTSDLIPLCHNISLSVVKVDAQLIMESSEVILISTVRCAGQTGVEMEALTSVAIAALTVYDMCKAVSHDIVIKNIVLLEKSGGKRDFKKDSNASVALKDPRKSNLKPLENEEKFYPSHI